MTPEHTRSYAAAIFDRLRDERDLPLLYDLPPADPTREGIDGCPVAEALRGLDINVADYTAGIFGPLASLADTGHITPHESAILRNAAAAYDNGHYPDLAFPATTAVPA